MCALAAGKVPAYYRSFMRYLTAWECGLKVNGLTDCPKVDYGSYISVDLLLEAELFSLFSVCVSLKICVLNLVKFVKWLAQMLNTAARVFTF